MISLTPAAPQANTEPSGNYKWAVVGMLSIICLFNYADREAISATFPLLEREFGFTKEQLGWIKSSFMIVYALSAPLAGPVGDRFSRKFIILAGLYVWSAITGFTALCSQYWQFILVRASEGLGETFYFPASMSLVSDYHGKRTRSRAMAMHQMSVYGGIIVGGSMAGWMGERFGWQTPFIFLGVAGIVLGFVLGAFIREPRRNEAEIRESTAPVQEESLPHMSIGKFAQHMLTTPTALILLAVFVCANFVAWIPLTWMPTYVYERFEMSVTRAAFIGTLFLQLGSMAGSLSGGFLADAWRSRAAGGRIATQAVGLLIGAPAIYYCGVTDNLNILMLSMVIFGFCKGIYDSNIWAAMYDVIPASRRGTVVGWANCIGWLGGAAGPVVIGRGVDSGRYTLGGGIAAMAGIYITIGTVALVSSLLFAPRDIRRTAASQ